MIGDFLTRPPELATRRQRIAGAAVLLLLFLAAGIVAVVR